MSNVYPHSINIQTLSTLNSEAARVHDEYADWYVAPVMVCPRVASVLDASNFDVMGVILDDAGIQYEVIRMNHCATMYSYIVVEPTDKALELLEETLGCLHNYPVLSDDHYAELQDSAICEHWEMLTGRERLEIALECGLVCDEEPDPYDYGDMGIHDIAGVYERLSETIW